LLAHWTQLEGLQVTLGAVGPLEDTTPVGFVTLVRLKGFITTGVDELLGTEVF